MEHSANFDWWKQAYTQGWATNEQLKMVVEFGALTEEEFKEITGEDYTD